MNLTQERRILGIRLHNQSGGDPASDSKLSPDLLPCIQSAYFAGQFIPDSWDPSEFRFRRTQNAFHGLEVVEQSPLTGWTEAWNGIEGDSGRLFLG